MMRRIRTAMGQRDEKYLLCGIVELDDGYVGGVSHNGKRGRGTDKTKIVVALSKTETGIPLFTKMKVVQNIQGKTLQEIIDQQVAPQTKVECDGFRSYLNLDHVELRAKIFKNAYDVLLPHHFIERIRSILPIER